MNGAPAHLLVVDDLADNRNLLVQLLTHAGYRVSEAANGAEALARHAADPADLVLLDLMMPVLDGFATLERLKADDPSVPVVVVTAVTEREERLRAIALGADEYLAKPIDPPELFHRVRWLLRLQAANRSLASHAEEVEREVVRRTAEVRQYELMVASVVDYAILMLDPDGRITTWNPGAERLKGYTADEAIGRPLTIFYEPADVAAGVPDRLLAEARRLGHVEAEGWRVRKDGSRFWASVVITAIPDATGATSGFAKITRDLTERKRAEEALTAHARDLEDANQRLVAQSEELQAQTEELQAQAEELNFQAAELQAQTVELQDQHGALQASNAQLHALADQLRELDALKDHFLAVLSHELRTPLNAIMSFASVLDDEVAGPLTEEQHRYLAKILAGSDLLLALINDLLDMSRIQAGTFVLSPERVAPADVCREVVGNLQLIAERKDQRLSCDVAPELPALEADRQRVLQVLINLVNNAIKFSPVGTRIDVTARRDGDGVRFEVRDEGPGIAAKDVPRLFHRFTQLEIGNTRSASGTGLGLSISKALVEAHGGEIGVVTAPGEGSVFWFVLPLQPTKQAASRHV